MSSNLPDDIINRLTKSLLGVLGRNRQENAIEEIVISDEDSLAEDRGTNESNSEEFAVISSSEEHIQNDRSDKVNPSTGDSESTKGDDDKSTKAEDVDDEEGDSSGERTSHCEDGNESDVIDIYDNDEDLFKKLDGQPMVCNRCYPSSIFRKKSLFIIHRIRHFSENHFVCPICRQGFVKLLYCINHELREHGEETQLNDQGFASAVSLILASGKNTTALINTQNNSNSSMTEKNIIYSDYAVASTSLYPYCGLPVDRFADSYEIQYKYGRPKKCMMNNIAKSVRIFKARYEAFAKQEMQAAMSASLPAGPNLDHKNNPSGGLKNNSATGLKKTSTTVLKTNSSTGLKTNSATGSSDKSDDHGSDSSYKSQICSKKRKKYRKKVKKGKKAEEKSYCCNICPFTCNLESEFKEHSQTKHPNFSKDQVLEYFILSSLGSYSPVRKKKTSVAPPPTKRTRYDLSEDSAGDSLTESFVSSSCPSSRVSCPSSRVEIEPMPDFTTKEGFCSSLGLIRKEPS